MPLLEEFIVLADYTTMLQALRAKIVLHLPQVMSGLVVLIAFWFGSMLLRQVILRLLRLRDLDESLAVFIAKTGGITLLTFGIVTALGTMGIDVAALVAGLGLTGFALGLALKDIISNVVSGVMILMHKPFRKGAQIKVAAFEGIVQEIDLRYTLLQSPEGDQIYVPNQLMFTNAILVRNPTFAAPAPPAGTAS